VDIYDSTTGQWSVATLSEARQQPAVAVIRGKAMIAGGQGTRESSALDIYDSASDAWSRAQLSLPRQSVRAAVVGRQAVFAGGSMSGFRRLSAWVDIFELPGS